MNSCSKTLETLEKQHKLENGLKFKALEDQLETLFPSGNDDLDKAAYWSAQVGTLAVLLPSSGAPNS